MDVDDITQPQEKPDFRRANGAPMYTDKEGKNKRGSRPSGWGKTLDDENALVNWKIDTAAVGVAGDSSLQAEYVALKPDDKSTKSKLREKAIQAGRGNTAADLGTALHAMSERWEDPDDDFDPPEPFKTSLKAYTAEMERIGIVSERMEYQVVNTEYNAAGTCDRLYRLTENLTTPNGDVLSMGTLVIGDLKTGKSLDFSLPGYHVQMAIYALGEFYNVEIDEFMPTPTISVDWGLIVHMPASGEDAGKCEILWCDLQIGNYGAYLVNEIRDWRKKWRSGAYASPQVKVGEGYAPDSFESIMPGVKTIDASSPEFVVEMKPFVKARMERVREHPQALKKLMLKWPEGCPPPAKITSAEELTRVLDVLDKIEAEFGFPFPEADPRAESGVHQDDLNTTNKPQSGRKESSL